MVNLKCYGSGILRGFFASIMSPNSRVAKLIVSCLLMLCNSSPFWQVSTWMRHAEREDKDNHAKEHIVCEADDHGE